MELATLVLEYLKVLVWPAFSIFVLFFFRKPLSILIGRIESAALPGGVSLDFGKEAILTKELALEVEESPQETPEPAPPIIPKTEANQRMLDLGLQPSPSGLDLERYCEQAQRDPTLALGGLAVEAEILVRNLATGFKIHAKASESTNQVLRTLRNKFAITPAQYRLALKVIQLCEAAMRGGKVTQESAESIIDSAGALVRDYLAWLSWGFKSDWTP